MPRVRCCSGAGEVQAHLPERHLSRARGDELLRVLGVCDRAMEANDQIVQKMRAEAEAALKNAYCRYSEFAVGAAVLTEGNKIFAGCNVENASSGLTSCAERNAIFQAVAAGGLSERQKLKAVVIVTPAPKLTAPCGACRQVIYEFCEEADADIFIFGANGAASFKLSALLPEAFGPNDVLGS